MLSDDVVMLEAAFDTCATQELRDILARDPKTWGSKENPSYVGWDFGGPRGDRAVEVVMSKDANGMFVHDVIEHPIHDSDCATHNEPAFPNGPCDCPHSRMDDDGAPNFGREEEKKPFDFSALNRAMSNY
ncbi:hypothetical protein GC167_05945 [bacterium]|nr:hypothetical protein [bacterium]